MPVYELSLCVVLVCIGFFGVSSLFVCIFMFTSGDHEPFFRVFMSVFFNLFIFFYTAYLMVSDKRFSLVFLSAFNYLLN